MDENDTVPGVALRRNLHQPDISSPLAHLLVRESIVHKHQLDAHLQGVASLAGDFADAFNMRELACLAGLWHDVGKFSNAFQQYLHDLDAEGAHLEGQRGRVDHSTAGAVHAVRLLEKANPLAARILAYCIAGHHTGLADWHTSSDSSLSVRLARMKSETSDALERAPSSILNQPAPSITPIIAGEAIELAAQAAFLVRMLFSAVVDADFLDTEAFMNAQQAAKRRDHLPDVDKMHDTLMHFLQRLNSESKQTAVNQQRRGVLQACLDAAKDQPGFFSLTAPTGSGKTLSSLAFALSHAREHRLSRVVYAVPFTSIIEQNADVFRQALSELGPSAVVEHHCSIDPEKETPTNRLACENWDAGIIVTTNVQLFESLYASKTSRCRKLHNLARSVIVLDEAQALPVEFIAPCLAALKELVRNYGCTVVLCTATQPAVHRGEQFPIGIDSPREIITDAKALYASMKRVHVRHAGRLSDPELLQHIGRQRQALCIVNTRSHAAGLYAELKFNGDAHHLSAAMCPQHRSEKLAEIRRLLDADRPCRVVSTQLIEAGVDIDFPMVYRAISGLDSIAQAAGRCNREGKLQHGEVLVFEGEEPPPVGHLKRAADTAGELIGLYDDMLCLDAIEQYFSLHYWKCKEGWDQKGVLGFFKISGGLPVCDFEQAAKEMRLITDVTKPVLVPWGNRGQALIAELRDSPFPDRKLRRALQRYTVSVYEKQWQQLRNTGRLDMLHDQYPVLIDMDQYDENVGLQGLLSYDYVM